MSMLLSPYQVQIAPSPVTSTLKIEQNQCIVVTHCIYSPHIAFHSQLTVIILLPNMSMLSLADPAKLKKLVNIFRRTPQIQLRDAITLAKYSDKEPRIKPFAAFFSTPSSVVPSRHSSSRRKLLGSYRCHPITIDGEGKSQLAGGQDDHKWQRMQRWGCKALPLPQRKRSGQKDRSLPGPSSVLPSPRFSMGP